ncbi:MAG: M28 family peptidase [Candidatus Wallbacteria bacterium]|nr:M28 family peptidase [Candidatus Wallbacteria bacterium]
MMRGLLVWVVLAAGTAGAIGATEPASWNSPAQIRADIEFLASDECQGRGVGSPGIERAQKYIAAALQRSGVRPLGDAGTWFQKFEVTVGVRVEPSTRLTCAGQPEFLPGADFQPLALSGSGSVAAAPVVFAGYGVSAPELHYDDYAGLDVKGKVVLAIAHDPRELDQKSPFRAPAAFRYTENRYKAIAAREHGAAALVIVNDAWRHPKDADTPIAFDGGHAVSPAGLPVASVTARLADKLLAPLGASSAGLGTKLDANLTPGSRAVSGATLSVTIALKEVRGAAANVVGILPGSDTKLAGEAVAIGAHHDHLGLGGVYSLSPSAAGSIHHGADDNASGAAGVLALARRFGNASPRPARSLVFVTFTAEELGLLGSAHFVKNSPVPLSNIVAMLNMDMIGRLREGKVTVQGVETAAEFKQALESAATGSKLKLTFSGDGYGPSDQTSFYAKDRPVLFFFTGPHTDYHRPTDTADKINANGEAQVLEAIGKVVATLAAGKAPTFARAKSAGSGSHRTGGQNTGRGYGPYFGSIPDFSEFKGGVLLSGVRPGSPAEKAGVRGADAIVKFGGVTIGNLEDFTYALQTHRPGDQVEVEVLRGGKIVRVKATLEKRK